MTAGSGTGRRTPSAEVELEEEAGPGREGWAMGLAAGPTTWGRRRRRGGGGGRRGCFRGRRISCGGGLRSSSLRRPTSNVSKWGVD